MTRQDEQKKQPYTVEVDKDGCPHCSAGRMWTVVGPDGYGLGQSWEDRNDAEDMAGLLNAAHEYALMPPQDDEVRR